MRREHCTPVQSLALRVDGALDARGSVVLVGPALLGLRRGEMLLVGDSLKLKGKSISTVDELVAYATIACALQKRKRKRNIWTKASLYTRQLAYVTEALRRRLDKLRTNLPGTFEHGYSFHSGMRRDMTPNESLMATLRYSATGRTLEDLKFSNVRTLLNSVFPPLCKYLSLFCCARAKHSLNAPFHVLSQCPTTEKKWGNVAREFEHRWNFPNRIGAVVGKHVATTPPQGQVLLGIANASYELLYFSFGTNGRVSDGGVFEASDLSKKTRKREPELAKGGNCRWKKYAWRMTHFHLGNFIMKPFSRKVATPARKIFNYRLSRARRVIESVFGIIGERLGVLQKPISLIDLTKVHHIVMACFALHSFLRSKVPHQYIPLECLDEEEFESGNVTPGPRCNESVSLSKTACYPINSAELVRESFVHYFNNEGQVPLATKLPTVYLHTGVQQTAMAHSGIGLPATPHTSVLPVSSLAGRPEKGRSKGRICERRIVNMELDALTLRKRYVEVKIAQQFTHIELRATRSTRATAQEGKEEGKWSKMRERWGRDGGGRRKIEGIQGKAVWRRKSVWTAGSLPDSRTRVKAVHDKVITYEINLRKKSLSLPAHILMSALSDIRP
ncbi:hypothetical protein PR048_019085, partial [Dryococelus australis]